MNNQLVHLRLFSYIYTLYIYIWIALGFLFTGKRNVLLFTCPYRWPQSRRILGYSPLLRSTANKFDVRLELYMCVI